MSQSTEIEAAAAKTAWSNMSSVSTGITDLPDGFIALMLYTAQKSSEHGRVFNGALCDGGTWTAKLKVNGVAYSQNEGNLAQLTARGHAIRDHLVKIKTEERKGDDTSSFILSGRAHDDYDAVMAYNAQVLKSHAVEFDRTHTEGLAPVRIWSTRDDYDFDDQQYNNPQSSYSHGSGWSVNL